jgi:hypothetical protein
VSARPLASSASTAQASWPRRAPSRKAAKDHPDRGREGQRQRVDTGVEEKGRLYRLRQHERSREREQHADHATQGRAHDGFDQELQKHRVFERADGQAHADLACGLGDADLGPWCQNVLLTIGSAITGTGSGRVIFALPQSGQVKALVETLKARMQAGEFRAVIDLAYPLEAIADAYRYVETERKTGIVVIDVSSSAG